MSGWIKDDLDRIDAAEEMGVAAVRGDGSLRPYVTIWVVRVGDELLARSYRSRDAAWLRHAPAARDGRIRSSGVEHDVVSRRPLLNRARRSIRPTAGSTPATVPATSTRSTALSVAGASRRGSAAALPGSSRRCPTAG